MSRLQRWLTRLYGSSAREQDEITQRTAEAVRERAETRRRELGAESVDYSRSVVNAYGGGRNVRGRGGERDGT